MACDRWAIEVSCVVAFSSDLIIRGVGAAAAGKVERGPDNPDEPDRWHFKDFVGDAMNWIDFMAIFPFYVRLVIPNFVDLRFLRVIRLARILRSLKSARYGSLGAVVVDIVINSVGALFIPVYFMVLSMVPGPPSFLPSFALLCVCVLCFLLAVVTVCFPAGCRRLVWLRLPAHERAWALLTAGWCCVQIVFASIMFYVEQTKERKCHLGDGTVVNDWDSQNTTAGNEGCGTAWGCTCPGTLTYHTYDGAEWSDEMFESIPVRPVFETRQRPESMLRSCTMEMTVDGLCADRVLVVHRHVHDGRIRRHVSPHRHRAAHLLGDNVRRYLLPRHATYNRRVVLLGRLGEAAVRQAEDGGARQAGI